MNPLDAVTQWNKAWNAGDAEAVVSSYSPDAVFRHPMVPDPMVGREAIGAFVRGIAAAFTEVNETVTRSLVSENEVAAEVRHRARNTGEIVTPTGAIPATGKVVEMLAAHFFRVGDDGLIAEEHMYADGLAFMSQLGVPMEDPSPS